MIRAARHLLPLLLLVSMPAAGQVGTKPDTATQEAKSIVTEPLDDTNLRKRPIPEVLVRISAEPYSLDGIRSCKQIAAAVGELDAVLGPDVDAPPAPEDKARSAVAVGREVIGGFLPVRGLIRELSGASRAQREYYEAVYAGLARRAYLKGVAHERRCKLPPVPVAS